MIIACESTRKLAVVCAVCVAVLVVFAGWFGYQCGKSKANYSHVAVAWLKVPNECNKYLAEGAYSNVQCIVDQQLDAGIIQGVGLWRSIFLSGKERAEIEGLVSQVLPSREFSESLKIRCRYDHKFRDELRKFKGKAGSSRQSTFRKEQSD